MRKIMLALAMIMLFGCAITAQERDDIIKTTFNLTQESNFERWLDDEISQYQSVVQAQSQSDARVTVLDYVLYDSYSIGLAKVKVELPNREIIGHFVVMRPVANWMMYNFVLISNEEVENDVKRQLEAVEPDEEETPVPEQPLEKGEENGEQL